MVLTLFALLIAGARGMAPTADEPAHMAGGYGLIARGAEGLDVLSQRGYPPLMPALQGALIALSHPDIPIAALDGWPEAFDVFTQSFAAALPSFERGLFVSRLPAIWMTVLMAAVAYRWASSISVRPRPSGYTPRVLAGLLAMALCLVDPTLLAHGRLATTDAGITFLGLTALYAAWRWTRMGGWRWSLACGLFLGATMLTKVSGPLWLAVAGLVMVGGLLRTPDMGGRACRPVHLVATVALALLILWGGYGFAVGPLADTGLIVPAPNHWRSTFYLTDYRSRFFAFGERQRESWWWYFPAAFMIKNPLPLLIAWLGGVLALLGRRRGDAEMEERRSRLALATLLAFPILYTVVATVEGMNIGYRHMLPIHPLLHIAAGIGLARLWRRRARHRTAILALALLSAVVTWRTFPNELAFFNRLIGGPEEGHRYLVDANLDWGQNVPAFEAYVAAHPDVLTESPATPFRPAPGRYIVGASELQGVGVAQPAAYAWFRQRDPVAQPVAGLLVYDVVPFDPQWVAQCVVPTAPLTSDEIASGFPSGAGGALRQVGFDCTESWLLPGGGAAAGIYALPTALMAPPSHQLPSGLLVPPQAADAALRRWLTSVRLSYFDDRAAIPFALYEFAPAGAEPSSVPLTLPENGPILPAFAETPPSALLSRPEGTVAKPEDSACPCALDGPLTLLGIAIDDRGEVLDIETWWRVDAGPIARNFSLLGQLIDPSGAVLATADGLGVFPTALLAGDRFIQRHRLADLDSAGERWFRTGAYWLDTQARWPTDPDGADVFLMRLP